MMAHTANSESIGDIAEQLRQQELTLNQRHAELKVQLRQADGELRRIRAALRALGQPIGGAEKRPASTALTTRDVFQLIDDILVSGNPASAGVLRAQVEARARAAGRSLIGFHLRFAKALQNEKFLVAGTGSDAVVSRRSAEASARET